jgi:enterochelin esterase-like enzyme
MLIEPDSDPAYCQVTFDWQEDDPEHPARDVFVRMINSAERARTARDLAPYLMTRGAAGRWSLTLRLRADLRASYQFCVSRDVAIRDMPLDDEHWRELLAMGVPDPADAAPAPPMYGSQTQASLLELPQAPPQPWLQRRLGIPAGALTTHEVASELFGNTRTVGVYLPPSYADTDRGLPLAVLLDGDVWLRAGVDAMMDNLIAEGLVPPTIVVAVDSLDSATRRRELTEHERFETFMLGELLPWITRRWAITEDPARTVIAGQSMGGLAACDLGLRAAHRFGLVLCQSGSFWWPDGGEFDSEAGALIRRFAHAPVSPVRIYQEVGLLEDRLLAYNRHLRDVLHARGYPLTYREYHGGHDYACWRGGLADGLADLLGQA